MSAPARPWERLEGKVSPRHRDRLAAGYVRQSTAQQVQDHQESTRLLLGLKGTISEAELHLIKQRMWTGRLAKARRGELAVPLPSGFVRRPAGEVALDPDEQVRAVIRLVFELFDRLGTVNAVLCFLADNHIQA